MMASGVQKRLWQSDWQSESWYVSHLCIQLKAPGKYQNEGTKGNDKGTVGRKSFVACYTNMP